MMNRIENDGILRLCDGKKMYFDWLKMSAIWSKKMFLASSYFHPMPI